MTALVKESANSVEYELTGGYDTSKWCPRTGLHLAFGT